MFTASTGPFLLLEVSHLSDRVISMNGTSTTVKIQLLELVSLKLNDRGSDVLRLQHVLNNFGYDCGEEDGCYGDRTAAAVMEVQKHFGLNSDGIFGPVTWYAMSFWAVEEKITLENTIWQQFVELCSAVSKFFGGYRTANLGFSTGQQAAE